MTNAFKKRDIMAGLLNFESSFSLLSEKYYWWLESSK